MTARVRIVNNLPRFTDQMQIKAERLITQVLVTGAAHAAVMTPVDTSFLLNSQYRRVDVSGEKIVGTCGYIANYALFVHSKDHPQNFRRATAEKEFLTKGFEESAGIIDTIIEQGLKA